MSRMHGICTGLSPRVAHEVPAECIKFFRADIHDGRLGDVLMRVEAYFKNRPQARVLRHHAMVDAEALRWAFEGAINPPKNDL
ncbi:MULTISPECIES: hypothetical protein [unclassified Lysobacter]|uniref:hypothetical protein n=1 Tax=unclassified Lysobacter TaxID=2635362 RepID=UPI0012FBF9C7|nr:MULTISPECIES: hypothetical protein [unclassified Lysobacter]